MTDSSLHPDIQILNAAADLQRVAKSCADEPPEALSASQISELVSAALKLTGRMATPAFVMRMSEPDASITGHPRGETRDQFTAGGDVGDDADDEHDGPVESIDFLLAHSTALRSIMIGQSSLIALAALPADHACRSARAQEGQDALKKGLATLDRLVTAFVTEQESPIPLAEWTEALKPEDRAAIGNALRGLIHYRDQLGPESGVAVICQAVLYAVAENRVSIGGTVPPAPVAFRAFLDDLHKLAGQGLALDAQGLSMAVMRTLAAIIAFQKGDRLTAWFQELAQAAAQNS